jgi:hypothetical protein
MTYSYFSSFLIVSKIICSQTERSQKAKDGTENLKHRVSVNVVLLLQIKRVLMILLWYIIRTL